MSKRDENKFYPGDIVNHVGCFSDHPMIVIEADMVDGEHYNNQYWCTHFDRPHESPVRSEFPFKDLVLDTRYDGKSKAFRTNIYNFSSNPAFENNPVDRG